MPGFTFTGIMRLRKAGYIELLTKSEVIVCTFGSFIRRGTRSNICDEM